MIKKSLLILIIVITLFLGFLGLKQLTTKKSNIYTIDGLSMVAKTEERSFMVYHNGKFDKSFLTGVNMGATIPLTFPGELAISKQTYLRWFKQIHDMHADVIRVYTTMKPEFYEALYQFNQTSKRPLYLMQGVWINEYDARDLADAFGDDGRLLDTFIKDATDLVDIIHGQKTLDFQYGFAHGTYTANVSPYVIGWILGVEWDPTFVIGTNENNQHRTSYDGDYLYSDENALPFELFLTEVGDKIIKYEVENYSFMRPVSYTNWLTTDHLTHPNEPDEREDLVSVNTELIKAKPAFISGLFASYHVYPYYPEFMNYSNEYISHIDKRGNINPYKAYLDDLYDNLTVPVLVAEFGVPASRGKTHEAIQSGFNQGFITEKEQGEMLSHMLEDIYDAKYMGALVFSWQDEWFKRTWNTMDFDLPLRRPFWSNAQTNEQHFGLLAFDPGDERSIRYVDGNVSDWKDDVPVIENDQLSLYTAFDERYVYIYIEAKSFDISKDHLLIPVMTNRDQGNTFISDTQIQFSHAADFIIDIKGIDDAYIRVDPYYDPFYFLYHEQLNLLPKNPLYKQKNTGLFVDMYQALSAEIYLPENDEIIPFSKHLTGKLIHGIANPSHKDYHSLADFYIKGNHIEIKIPWQLLNISDPSSKMMLSDFYTNNEFNHEHIEGIFIGAHITSNLNSSVMIQMAATTWDAWENPSYHERLKDSYWILKETFKRFSK